MSGGGGAGGWAGLVVSGGVVSPPHVRTGWAQATVDVVSAATNAADAADTSLLP
jgi:hypothetical protein